MKTEIEIDQRLKALAHKRSIPFCYGCYQEASTGVCPSCFSDDLMRLVKGVGVEYGTDWVIKEILKKELTPVNVKELFEEAIREGYPKTVQVGWMELDTVSVMKEMDPICWEMAQSDWVAQEIDEENIISFDDDLTYYYFRDVEALCDQEGA